MLNRYCIVLLVFLLHSGFAGRPVADTRDKIRILFVGNSLTYTNDLPALITEIAKQDGVVITSASFLFPDYALEDHWNEGKVQKELQKGKYDYMVAQQGPSGAPESQVLLLDYAGRYAAECNKTKTKLALYMVWPAKARSFDHDNVIKSYTNAAAKTSSLLCPAGLAWKYAWQTDSELPLYSPDGFHPSVTGSVLAALVIYGSLAGKKDFDFIKHESCSWRNEVTKDRLNILVPAALKALNK